MNRWVELKQQGPSEHPFPEEENYSDPKPVHKLHQRRSREGPPSSEREIDEICFCSWDREEDISRLRQEGFDIDDGKEYFSNNDPRHMREDTYAPGQTWGWDGIDHR